MKVAMIVSVILFNCCAITNKKDKQNNFVINDSLIHIVEIDSNNFSILKEEFIGYNIKECKLSFKHLNNIETKIYEAIERDTFFSKSKLYLNFTSFHRQYIVLNNDSNEYLYINYILIIPDERKKRIFKDQNIWSKFMISLAGENIYLYDAIFNLNKEGDIKYRYYSL